MIWAMEKGFDYLLFADSDSVWLPDDLVRLVDMDKPVACGWYVSRTFLCGEKNAPVLMRREPHGYALVKDIPKEPFTVDAIGAGFMLLKKEVIEKMQDYAFDMMDCAEMGLEPTERTRLMGEDMSFCYRLQKLGYEIWVDPEVHVGHANIEVLG